MRETKMSTKLNDAAIGLLWPERTSTPSRHARIRKLTAATWLLASGIQFAVWALIVMIGLDWQAPWWLWTFVPGAVVTAGVWWLTELDLQSRSAP
jgi:hypothetical protein